VLFLSYVFFSTTERYEVDFTTLFLFGAVAAWVALSKDARGWRRQLVRIGGGALAVWSCIAGAAISFTGYYNLLATTHPGTWRTLQDLSSPVSQAVAIVEGHSVLAEASAPNFPLLLPGEAAHVVIVSPDSRTTMLLAALIPAVESSGGLVRGGYSSSLLVSDPNHASSTYRIPAGGAVIRISASLGPGLNRLALTPLASKANGASAAPASQHVLYISGLSLAGGQ
jgi:hypothetical protein